MRNIKDLLILVRKHKVFLEGRGLCYLTDNLFINEIIDERELNSLKSYFYNNKPRRYKGLFWMKRDIESNYYFKPGTWFLRYIWLSIQILKIKIKT